MAEKLSFGDRMKAYERREGGRRLMPMVPALARLDGRSFSRFTKGLERPFDRRFSNLMVHVATELVRETGAVVGYTQSDEISLVWYSDDYKRQIFFDGRIQKMVSVLASLATAHFNAGLAEAIPEKADKLPVFDCRVFSVPTKVEAVNVLLWRERDATKNSVSMAARAHYSHKQLHGKSGSEMQDMLMEKGVNWNDYPSFFKRGTYIRARTVQRPFSAEELAALPPRHDAHKNPDLLIQRTVIEPVDMPPLGRVTNREAVIFDGAEPEQASSEA